MSCGRCGADHSALKINGKAVCPACYLEWLEQQPGRSKADLHQRIAELEAEIVSLKDDNAYLRKRLHNARGRRV